MKLKVLGFLAASALLAAAEGTTFVVERMCQQSLVAMSDAGCTVSAERIDCVPWRMEASLQGVSAVWKDGSTLRIPEIRIALAPQAFLACAPRLNAQVFSPWGRDLLADRIEAPSASYKGADGTRIEAGQAALADSSASRELMRALDAGAKSSLQGLAASAAEVRKLRIEGPSGAWTADALLARRVQGTDAALLEAQNASWDRGEDAGSLQGLKLKSLSLRSVHVPEGVRGAFADWRGQSGSKASAAKAGLALALARNGALFGTLRIEGALLRFSTGDIAFAEADGSNRPDFQRVAVRGLVASPGLLRNWGIALPDATGTLDAAAGGDIAKALAGGEVLPAELKLSLPRAFEADCTFELDFATLRFKNFALELRGQGGLAKATAGMKLPAPGGVPIHRMSGRAGALQEALWQWAGTERSLRVRQKQGTAGGMDIPGADWLEPASAGTPLPNPVLGRIEYADKWRRRLAEAGDLAGGEVRMPEPGAGQADAGNAGTDMPEPLDVKPDEDDGGTAGGVEVFGETEDDDSGTEEGNDGDV